MCSYGRKPDTLLEQAYKIPHDLMRANIDLVFGDNSEKETLNLEMDRYTDSTH